MTDSPQNPSTQPTPEPAAPRTDTRPEKPEALGHIQADRPCARCGFNLFGQPIFRDEHYQMPVARCPECGQVAPLQEYPGLGVWARRWSAMVAAVWLLLAVGYLAFTLVMVTMPVGALHEDQHRGLTVSIVEMFNADNENASETANPNFRPWASLPDEWLDSQDLPARVRANGSVLSQLDPTYPVVVASLWLTLYAVFLPWPVLMVRSSRTKVAVYLGLALAIGATLVGALNNLQATTDSSASNLALGIAWPTMLAVTYGSLLTAALAAAFTGRPLARALIRATLPPRMRLPFAELWRADRKSMPAITGVGTNEA